jgi:hypothetical protein
MQHFSCYGDQRSKDRCVHCGGPNETDDHVPSKVLLDEPYPDNLIVCPSCAQCNNGLSSDEEYLACLLECAIAGHVDPARVSRARIARTLERNAGLTRQLQSARTEVDGRCLWKVENDRVTAVLLKLARGHAAYEQNLPQTETPTRLVFCPLETMSGPERDSFEGRDDNVVAVWPEVGTRAMQRLLVAGGDVFSEGWLVVQEGNYRFRVDTDDGVRVRMVLREYLASDVAWE